MRWIKRQVRYGHPKRRCAQFDEVRWYFAIFVEFGVGINILLALYQTGKEE